MYLKYLAVAAGTILFYMGVLPCFDALSNWVQSYCNVKTGRHNVEINKLNVEAQEIQAKTQDHGTTNAIGFQIGGHEDEAGEDCKAK